jgi:hypothetical protein
LICDLVKKNRRFNFEEVRQRFRLTPTERRVSVFIVAAFTLGLVTKCYRDAHSALSSEHDPHRNTEASVRQAKAMQAGEVDANRPGTRRRKSAQKLNLSDSATER